MSPIALGASALFILGYLLIALEHKLSVNKSAISLTLGVTLWLVVAFSGISHDALKHALEGTSAEIFDLFAFLLAAMTLVEILIHYQLFDFIRYHLLRLGLKDRMQFVVIGILTFFLSAVLDNLTITIVMIQIARQFFVGANLLTVAGGIVILANAGGAWSPIGDVTTIMLWLAKKFSVSEIITQGLIPAMALGVTAIILMMRKVNDTTIDNAEISKIKLTRGQKAVIGVTLLSFSLPLVMNLIGLAPYFGLVLGLGFVWSLIEFIKSKSNHHTHLTANIDKLLQKTDIASLQFFAGILLAVSALHALGVLEFVSSYIFGKNPDMNRFIIANSVLGLLSAVVDNVPLTALAIDIIHTTDTHVWVLLALTVGTGGSFLIIGSVAGIVAMGMVKELTFDKYLKIAGVPALIGYLVMIAVWLVQYQFIK